MIWAPTLIAVAQMPMMRGIDCSNKRRRKRRPPKAFQGDRFGVLIRQPLRTPMRFMPGAKQGGWTDDERDTRTSAIP
jgi:hypothetical protein